MVKYKVGVWVLEAVQIPVGVRRQHDRRSLGQSESAHPDVPFIGSHSVGDVGDNFTGKAFGAVLVSKGKRDGVGGVSHDGPVPPVPALGATVESIVVVVFVREDVGGLAVDGEGGVLDAVGVAALMLLAGC
jgi:hypothetical protein